MDSNLNYKSTPRDCSSKVLKSGCMWAEIRCLSLGDFAGFAGWLAIFCCIGTWRGLTLSFGFGAKCEAIGLTALNAKRLGLAGTRWIFLATALGSRGLTVTDGGWAGAGGMGGTGTAVVKLLGNSGSLQGALALQYQVVR